MMNWKQVKDELPPIGEEILLGTLKHLGDRNAFYWTSGYVYRPYDQDKKFNPNYYEIDFKSDFYNKNRDRCLGFNDFWLKIETPINEIESSA